MSIMREAESGLEEIDLCAPAENLTGLSRSLADRIKQAQGSGKASA